jgi:hypothetical protein
MWASVWGLTQWFCQDFTQEHPSFFENETARQLAYEGQDPCDDPEDKNQTVECLLLLLQTNEVEFDLVE